MVEGRYDGVAVFTIGRAWTTTSIFLVAVVLFFAVLFVWQEIEELRGKARGIQAIFDSEKKEWVIERKELENGLTQARSVTSQKEDALKDALGRVDASEKVKAALLEELKKKTAVGVGTSEGRISVADTASGSQFTPTSSGGFRARTDWITLEFKPPDSLTYEFEAFYKYYQVRHVLPEGVSRLVEYAEIVSIRNPSNRKFVPVTSNFTTIIPPSRKFMWSPSLSLGATFPDPAPVVGLTLFSYGKVRDDLDHTLVTFPFVGVSLRDDPRLFVAPVTLNLTRLPLVQDFHVGLGITGRKEIRVLVRTTL